MWILCILDIYILAHTSSQTQRRCLNACHYICFDLWCTWHHKCADRFHENLIYSKNKSNIWFKKSWNYFLFYERTAKSIQSRWSKLFCFTFDFDETFLDCSTHEYYNLTKFRQNRMLKSNLTLPKLTFLFYIRFCWNFVRL